MNAPIKSLGLHEVSIRLHAEVSITITVNVARSPDEAERQEAGENVIDTIATEAQAADEEQAIAMAAAAAELDTSPEGDEE